MRVAILQTKPTPRAEYMLKAVAAGVAACGDSAAWFDASQSLDGLRDVDVAIQICSPNRHHRNTPLGLFRLAAAERLAAAKTPVVTIDTGFVYGQTSVEAGPRPSGVRVAFHRDEVSTYSAYDPHIYYAVGFGGIKRQADYCNVGVSNDRWQKLGCRLLPWRQSGKSIVLCGQPLRGQSSQEIDIYAWYGQVFRGIRTAKSPLPVVYRPHPRLWPRNKSEHRFKADLALVRRAAGSVRMTPSVGRPLRDDLATARVAVVYASNAAVECVIRGVPVVACSPLCAAWDVSSHSVAEIRTPATPARDAWAAALAYAQWNMTEMRSGECWGRLRAHVERIRHEADTR